MVGCFAPEFGFLHWHSHSMDRDHCGLPAECAVPHTVATRTATFVCDVGSPGSCVYPAVLASHRSASPICVMAAGERHRNRWCVCRRTALPGSLPSAEHRGRTPKLHRAMDCG